MAPDLATAVDVTLAELKLEAFVPADARTASALLALSGEGVWGEAPPPFVGMIFESRAEMR